MFRRCLAPLIGTLCLLGFSVTSSASAATLAVSAPDQQQPQAPFADVSGTADADSTVRVYGEAGGTSCGSFQNHFDGRTIGFVAEVAVPAGPFAVRAGQAGGGTPPGTYRLCAYLVRSGTAEADATAVATLRYRAPACPSAAFTLTGVTPTQGGAATVSTTIPGPGSLTATGSSGGTGSGSWSGGPATFTVLMGAGGRGALTSGKPVTETFTVTYTQQHVAPCSGPDGATVTSTSESRTVTVTFPPNAVDVDGGGDGVKRATWMRAVGRAALLDLYGKPGVVNGFGPICDRACEEPSAKMTIKVSAKVQKRYRLPSRTIAKSGPIKQRGEALLADLIATKKMVARLKKAKVKKLTTTVTFVAVSPVSATVVKQQVFRVGRYSQKRDTERFCMGTAKDKLCGKKG